MQFYGYRIAALCLVMTGAAAGQTPAPTPATGTQTAQPAAPKLTGFPWQNETLHYTMNWQSGLPIGDVYFNAHKSDGGWMFDVSGSAGVPGFSVNDKYTSTTGSDLCSTELARDTSHAGKTGREKTTFDQKAGTAQRVTLLPEGGGKSSFNIGTCARDAVAYSYYAREELGQGRMPPSVKVHFGSAYSVSMVYTGSENITQANKSVITDHVSVSVTGPRSDFHFDVYYARDPARTPLQILVPLSMGKFSLDLVR